MVLLKGAGCPMAEVDRRYSGASPGTHELRVWLPSRSSLPGGLRPPVFPHGVFGQFDQAQACP